uniref:SAM domain and HD domain-containing protein 1 n=1 Tax=Magallana gigas TaxID=29159 RepID=K1PVH3_MAGGI
MYDRLLKSAAPYPKPIPQFSPLLTSVMSPLGRPLSGGVHLKATLIKGIGDEIDVILKSMATKGNDVNVNDEVTSATTGPSEEDKQQAEVPQSQNTSRDAPEKFMVILRYLLSASKSLTPLSFKDCDPLNNSGERILFILVQLTIVLSTHSAGQLASALKVRQPHLGISKEDILCVQIAGLCHDLGHGPFSRMFEDKFLPMEWPYKGRPKKKDFLYEIVANKRNGVDVDKWDYLARDCHMLGIKSNFDHTRCMEYAKVLTEARNLYDMFYNWDTLKRRAYQHDVGEIIETMIADAMWEANKIIKITGTDGKRFEISRTVTHMEAYEKLNDSIIDIILLSEKEGLEKSKEILERVQKRELFTCVGEINDPKVINMTWEDYIKQAEKDYHGILVKKDSSWKLEDFFIHVIIADN